MWQLCVVWAGLPCTLVASKFSFRSYSRGMHSECYVFFFFQAEDGIRDLTVTGVQTCALPIYQRGRQADEMLRVFKALWTQDNPSFEGEFFRFKDIGFAPKPVQKPHPPIWVEIGRASCRERV